MRRPSDQNFVSPVHLDFVGRLIARYRRRSSRDANPDGAVFIEHQVVDRFDAVVKQPIPTGWCCV